MPYYKSQRTGFEFTNSIKMLDHIGYLPTDDPETSFEIFTTNEDDNTYPLIDGVINNGA